ncbi:MAG: hypothetical protein MR210_07065 [Erysipelotrichaceae bacterium]|nr:hypothetical protein [Erysipelotrichaceae bacterium]
MRKLLSLALIGLLLVGCQTTTTNTANETQATTTQTPPPTINFERGVLEDNVYTNDSIGVSIDIPTGFVALSDEQLLSLLTTNADNKGMDNFQEFIESQVVTYDFAMIDGSGTGSVFVGIENLVLENAQGLVHNENEYLAFVKANLEKDPNANYIFNDIYEYEGTDGEWYILECLDIDNLVGVNILAKYYGDYVVSIIYNYADGVDTSIVLSSLTLK